jgi:curved DNA-binding protein CbpA
MSPNPFAALGLPERPDLTDERVRAAWRAIAAATHPDRRDGGDIARYTAAASAYAQLRTGWGRTEAYADVRAGAGDTTPLPAADDPAADPANDTAPEMPLVWPGHLLASVRHLPGRIRHGRPLRLLTRGLAAALASLAVLHLIPGQPAAPALVTGLILWFVRTCPADLAPPPER